MGWTVLIGPQGGVLANYTSYVDFEYVNQLYDIGVSTLILAGIDSNAAPVKDMVLKIIWDQGLSSEVVKWEGIIAQADKKEQGNVYVIRAFTAEAQLHISQTGTYRNYLSATPYIIIQGSGADSLLKDNQGVLALPYGTSSAVSNKISAGGQGTSFGQFTADSTTLFNNIRRLCNQARYGDGSYGLEWMVRMEGANLSTPTFYLVKRRERAVSYTAEVLNIPDNLSNARRGTAQFPGVDSVTVVGGGSGTSRVQSVTVGTGDREVVVEDKAIFQQTNADNLATRVLGVYGVSIEVITASSFKHTSPSRVGDTCTITQTGVSNTNLRLVTEHYSLSTKTFTLQFGRPTPGGRDNLQSLLGASRANTTTPQFTDVKPEVIQFTGSPSTQFVLAMMPAPLTIGAGATATILDSNTSTLQGGSSLTDLGLNEGILCELVLDINAATSGSGTAGPHFHTYDKANTPTGSSGGYSLPAGPHSHTQSYTATSTSTDGSSVAVTIGGPYAVSGYLYFSGDPNDSGNTDFVPVYHRIFSALTTGRFIDMHTYPFAANSMVTPTNFTPRLIIRLSNIGGSSLTLNGDGTRNNSTQFGIWKNTLHRHNEITP